MHKYIILFFSLSFFLFSCSGSSVPSNLIQPERMTALLTQIHIADGNMYTTMQIPDSLYKYGTAKYNLVLKNFHTDSVQFKKSMKYYTDHPDILSDIYAVVSDNLKQKADSLNKLYQAQVAKDNKRRQDSLKRLPKQSQVQQPAQTPAVNPLTDPAKKRFTNKRYLPAKTGKYRDTSK